MRAASRRSRELGQNFLRDPNILGVIGRESELDAADVVLEIGGGEGVLSAYLAPRVAYVHVVEVDERLRERLEAALAPFTNEREKAGEHPSASVRANVHASADMRASANVRVWWADAMRMDLAELRPAPTKVVANLPYGIAAGVTLRTIEDLPSVKMWLVMVQREVGERMAATPGSGVYGVTSVLAQLAGEVRVVRQIPRKVFVPVPNVDSVLVRIERTGPAPAAAVRRLVHGAFAHRRKAMARSLALAGFERGREQVREALAALGHPPDERAERLSPREFEALARELELGGPRQASAGEVTR